MDTPTQRPAHRRRVSVDSGRGGLAVIGWLFADMMLGLFIIALATQTTTAPVTGHTHPAHIPTTSPAEPAPRARMEQAARVIAIDVNPEALPAGSPAAKRNVRKAISKEVADLEAAGRRAAMVLVWGYAPTVDSGMAIADAAEKQLARASKDVFTDAITREFWHRGDPGRVTLEIYLFGDHP